MNWKQWTCIVVMGCYGAAANAEPETPKLVAREKLRTGIAAFEEGQYEQAIQDLSEGYAIDPRPEFLYALGQSERKRGNCPRALEHYRAFLATNPSERQAEATQAHVERCERVIEDQRKSAPAPEVAPAQPMVDLPRRPWYKDWVGDALLGAGVVSLGVGTLFLLQGNGALDGKTSYGDHVAAAEDGKSQQTLGAVLLMAGGGLVAGGILRYLLHDRGPAKTTLAPTTLGSGRGFALAVSGTF